MKSDSSEKLSTLEIGAYFGLWISSVGYSIYNVILISNGMNTSEENYIYLDESWFYLSRRKDMADDEWRLAIIFLKIISPWIVLHLIVAQTLRKLNQQKLVPIWYTIITTLFCIKTFGVIATLLIWVQPCIALLLIILHNRTIIWIVNIIIIIIINGLRYPGSFLHIYLNVDEDTYYMLMVTISWLTLKSISCSFDLFTIHATKGSELQLENSEIVKIFAYMMYLPLMLFGPIELYCNFNRTCFNNHDGNDCFIDRFQLFIIHLCRYSAWLIFTEISLHFVYVTALQYNLSILNQSFWASYGLGYCMGQFFHLKYIVLYGFTTSIMTFENIQSPPTPKCIGRIHLYSYMWKHFDYGLYTFLVRYIYIPSGVSSSRKQFSKLISSFLCFGFVFIWHGMQLFIFIWSALNYIGVVIEYFSSKILETKFYRIYIKQKYSKQSVRRLKAILTTPLMISSALSNFFFFGGMEVGIYFVQKIFDANLQANIILFFCIYTLCQVSIEFMLLEKIKKLKKIN